MTQDDLPEEAGDVLRFWYGALTPEQWWKRDEEVDQEITVRFASLYLRLVDQVPESWLATPQGRLAAVIVLDQFPRNMFRDRPEAFAADDRALAVAKRAIDAGHDTALTQQQRAFLYMPFQHCEDLAEQQRSCDLFQSLDSNPDWYGYADRHREIVERFGRFPHRNRILGRVTTPEEAAFLKEPNSSF